LTWQAVREFAGRGFGAIAWTVDAETGSGIVVASGRELLWSADDGRTWIVIGTTPGEIATLWSGTEGGAPIMLIGQFEQGVVRLE
jgi:hypothetical protein